MPVNTQSTYVKHRVLLIEIFKYAISKGLIDINPAEQTLVKKAVPKKRKRWTKEQFIEMCKHAEPWLETALNLALYTLQRRDDLIKMKFDDVKDGQLYVLQHKTKKHLAIELGSHLLNIVSNARKSKIASPYILHRHPTKLTAKQRKNKTHWSAITGDYLTKAVGELRDKIGICDDMEAGEKPSLHELRSLGAHLYREAGFDENYIQALLGHDTKAMTEHYLHGYKIEWERVSAELELTGIKK